jgi:uncharacterized protein YjbJ (UPF0337 family)
VCLRTDGIWNCAYPRFGERCKLSAQRQEIVKIHDQEKVMNKDQIKGRVEETKGNVKEAVGKVVGNKELEQEGKLENAAGKVQAKYGDLKEDIKKTI